MLCLVRRVEGLPNIANYGCLCNETRCAGWSLSLNCFVKSIVRRGPNDARSAYDMADPVPMLDECSISRYAGARTGGVGCDTVTWLRSGTALLVQFNEKGNRRNPVRRSSHTLGVRQAVDMPINRHSSQTRCTPKLGLSGEQKMFCKRRLGIALLRRNIRIHESPIECVLVIED